MLLAAIVLQNLALLAVIAGLLLARGGPFRPRIAIIAAASVFIGGMFLAGVWVYPPPWGRAGYLALFVLASLRFLRRKPLPVRRRRLNGILVAPCLTAVGAVLIWQGIAGRLAPSENHISLAPPLEVSAGHCALSAGASTALNLHYVESGSPAASFEKHSVDFIKANRFGFRTTAGKSFHPKPTSNGEYAVFGAKVVAPCDGTVIESENDRADVRPGHRYRSNDGANLVTLACKGSEVLLAHFRQGSVRVAVGDQIREGMFLGEVGNSGNTEEPHLHIHAQLRSPDGSLSAVPMRFNGRYLARGDCL